MESEDIVSLTFMSEKLDWHKAAILELIDIWSSYEHLYNTKHTLYSKKHARYDALNLIAEKLKKYMPTVEASDVKLKMNYLRGQYSRELRKQKKTVKSGAGSDDIYESPCFWFKKMKFLEGYMNIRKDRSNLLEASSSTKQFVLDKDFDVSCEETIMSPVPPMVDEIHEKRSRKGSSSRTPQSSYSTSNDASFVSLNMLVSPRDNVRTDVEAFANHIKNEMNKITDEALQDEMELEIHNIIYRFKLRQRELNQNKQK